MQPAQLRHRAAVIDALLTQPQSFSFFQLVRLLDRWLAPADANARGVSKLHFRNSVSLSFPTSEVESLVVRARTSLAEAHDMPGGSDPVAGGLLAQALDETLAAQRSWRAQDVERIEITPPSWACWAWQGRCRSITPRCWAHARRSTRTTRHAPSWMCSAIGRWRCFTKPGPSIAWRCATSSSRRRGSWARCLRWPAWDSTACEGARGGCATRPWPVRPAPCSEGACQRCSCR